MPDKRFKCTHGGVADLPTCPKRTDYGDSLVRGLFVAVLPSGQKNFYIVRKVVGNVVRVLLGHFDPEMPGAREISNDDDPLALIGNGASLNVRMARQLAAAVNQQLDRGINPAAEKRAGRKTAAEELTLREAFERYYADHLVPHGRRSREAIRDDFARYLGAVPVG